MSKKILVVDDDPDVGQVLRMALEMAGYEAVLATSGAEGLQRVRDSRPDLVLLDVMMPGMDGWQVCHHVRQTTDVPVIMLTVVGSERDIARGFRLGAKDYIVKPWSNQELLARIRAVLPSVDTSPVPS